MNNTDEKIKYTLGIDIGTGSAGLSMTSDEGKNSKVLNAFSIIFDSGERPVNATRTSQMRRASRGTRRLKNRKQTRKKMIKRYFVNNGILSDFEVKNLTFDENIYMLKYKALDSKIEPDEILKCLIHTCNHRGYNPFYDDEYYEFLAKNKENDEVKEEKKKENSDKKTDEEKKNEKAVKDFTCLFSESGYRTVSEYIVNTHKIDKNISFKNRNLEYKNQEYLLIPRKLVKKEVELILEAQRKYYDFIDDNFINNILNYIFSQRCFEDGPGDVNNQYRPYGGYISEIGNCSFYPNEKRAFRSTLIADVYSLTNAVSLFRYIDNETGALGITSELAKDIVQTFLKEGKFNFTTLKKIAKSYNITVDKSEGLKTRIVSDSNKFTSLVKKAIEESGENWNDYICENQFDLEHPSKLHIIGEVISTNQTLSRKREALNTLDFLSDEMKLRLLYVKGHSTANVSYKYMLKAIDAFCSGVIYGDFQAHFVKEVNDYPVEKSEYISEKIFDKEIRKNPVVLKSLNMIRKAINEIVKQYGMPSTIVIEVAKELGKSYKKRNEETAKQNNRRKIKNAIIEKIAEITGYNKESVNSLMVDKYKLYYQQNGKCIYSNKELGDIKDVLCDRKNIYQIDHIVPQSLISDNSLNNKVLVFTKENQNKGNRCPLMWLKGEQRESYINNVKSMTKAKTSGINNFPINDLKYEYLMLESVYSDEGIVKIKDWKTRNLNDTRYIAKYAVSLITNGLKSISGEKPKVFCVNGRITSFFRNTYLRDTGWEDGIVEVNEKGKRVTENDKKKNKDMKTFFIKEKLRENPLHHAIDAIILTQLTPQYIEIANDAMKLITIKRSNKNKITPEYEEYRDNCIRKMKKYYGMDEEYVYSLLNNCERIPSRVPRLAAEVVARFGYGNAKQGAEEYNKQYMTESVFEEKTDKFYENSNGITVSPHIPHPVVEKVRTYNREMSDSNPLSIVFVDGQAYKKKRIPIESLTVKKFQKIRTNDKNLLNTLERIFKDKDTKKESSYSIKQYLQDNNLSVFKTDNGTPVYRVSILEKPINNLYKKEISDNNYTYIASPKYYCTELYKSSKGELKTRGIRFVDLKKINKKLVLNKELPEDYAEHIMYLQKGDYVEIFDKNNELKFKGYFSGVSSFVTSSFTFMSVYNSTKKVVSISEFDTVKKFEINMFGQKIGEIRHSTPFKSINDIKNETAECKKKKFVAKKLYIKKAS